MLVLDDGAQLVFADNPGDVSLPDDAFGYAWSRSHEDFVLVSVVA